MFAKLITSLSWVCTRCKGTIELKPGEYIVSIIGTEFAPRPDGTEALILKVMIREDIAIDDLEERMKGLI